MGGSERVAAGLRTFGEDATKTLAAAVLTKNLDFALKALKLTGRAERRAASDALHEAKKRTGRGGAANVEFDTRTGDIVAPETGEVIGNLFDWLP